MKKYLLTIAALIIVLLPAQALATGWGEQVPLQFKLMRTGAGQTNESLRLAYNRDLGRSGGSGSGSSQGQFQSNMNNVIQVTETYEIILNGDNNTVSTKGTVLNGEQASGETTQDGTNTVSANNKTQISNDASDSQSTQITNTITGNP